MEHARGARALREAAALPEPDARVGAVAVHLGLPDDAARLFASCGRWDLLQGLKRAEGDWGGALATAEAHDRWGPLARRGGAEGAAPRGPPSPGLHRLLLHHTASRAATASALPRCLPSPGRPRLRGLHFEYARGLELSGDLPAAARHYEAAGAGAEEVPRMMLEHGREAELEG
jgi:hypothetical protein